MFGYVLVNDDARRTLTPGITIVPVAIGFVYLQRFLVEGFAAGTVKE